MLARTEGTLHFAVRLIGFRVSWEAGNRGPCAAEATSAGERACHDVPLSPHVGDKNEFTLRRCGIDYASTTYISSSREKSG